MKTAKRVQRHAGKNKSASQSETNPKNASAKTPSRAPAGGWKQLPAIQVSQIYLDEWRREAKARGWSFHEFIGFLLAVGSSAEKAHYARCQAETRKPVSRDDLGKWIASLKQTARAIRSSASNDPETKVIEAQVMASIERIQKKMEHATARKYPVELDSTLEGAIRDMNADERQELGRIYERWAAQLQLLEELTDDGGGPAKAHRAKLAKAERAQFIWPN